MASNALPRVPLVLLALGAIAVTWAVVVWFTGGIAFMLGSLRVTSRAASRPAIAGFALLAAALWHLTPEARRGAFKALVRRCELAAPWIAGLAALGAALVSALLGIHVAGGSDSAGYLRQSQLLGRGQIVMAAPAIDTTDWPARGWLVSPFGFSPARSPDILAPTYAPGLPLLMAAAAAAGGEAGRFVWTPLFVGVLTALTYRFARRFAPGTVALAATLLVATSPPLLFAAMQSMSDIPVGALWMLALLGLTTARRSGGPLAAVSAPLALLVRPNLALVAAAIWCVSALQRGPAFSNRARRAVGLGALLGAVALAVAVMNSRMWGSPMASGYGAAADLFSWESVPPNLVAVWRWTRETGGYWMPVGAGALIWLVRNDRRWWPGAALAIAVVASYLPYFVFAEWWYLRFYVPAWPVLAGAAAVATWQLARRWWPTSAPLAVLAGAVVIAIGGLNFAAAAGVFELWRGEQRYPAVASFVRDQASARAIIVSVQHSGAESYYTGRAIGRFDHIDSHRLDALCDRWRIEGRDVWLVLESWEEPEFRRRFAGQVRGRLDWAPVGEARVNAARVRVYDLSTPTRRVGPAVIPVARRAPWPWLRLWVPTAAQPPSQ